jgi:hypothetical protein
MPFDQIVLAAAGLTGLLVVAATALRAWNGWLALKHEELAAARDGDLAPMGVTRIEMADLKERLRKLEAIASGVDL